MVSHRAGKSDYGILRNHRSGEKGTRSITGTLRYASTLTIRDSSGLVVGHTFCPLHPFLRAHPLAVLVLLLRWDAYPRDNTTWNLAGTIRLQAVHQCRRNRLRVAQ